MIETMCNEI
jgi:hypothetical protein